jgi:hypothetical protein
MILVLLKSGGLFHDPQGGVLNKKKTLASSCATDIINFIPQLPLASANGLNISYCARALAQNN